MTSKILSTSVRLEGDIAVIDMHGDINAFAEEGLNAAYNEAASHNTASIVLNFSGVEYINSTGIALIVGLMAQARKSHRRLLTCNLSDHYLEIFRVTRLSDFISIFPDEQSAIADARENAQE